MLFRSSSTGIALAVTAGVFYALCALLWVLAPGPFLGFINSLFHGMDFNSLVQPRPFAWSGFLVALLLLSGWALFGRDVLRLAAQSTGGVTTPALWSYE